MSLEQMNCSTDFWYSVACGIEGASVGDFFEGFGLDFVLRFDAAAGAGRREGSMRVVSSSSSSSMVLDWRADVVLSCAVSSAIIAMISSNRIRYNRLAFSGKDFNTKETPSIPPVRRPFLPSNSFTSSTTLVSAS